MRVPLDKNEGVVKRHFPSAMLSSTAWISERWRTEALKLSRWISFRRLLRTDRSANHRYGL